MYLFTNFPPGTPFPARTHGFMYYHSPPSIPPAAGEVRFRLTPKNNPKLFDLGRDFQVRDGMPWRVPLLAMFGNDRRKHLLQLLLADGLVTSALAAECAEIMDGCCGIFHQSRILHSLGQLFPIDFPVEQCTFFLLTRSGLRWNKLDFRPVQSKGYSYCGECINHAAEAITDRLGYPGSALCRFERSTLPEHQGTRTIVMRIIKIVSLARSSNYDPGVQPIEGQLVCYNGQTGHRPWSRNVDRLGHTWWKELYEQSKE
jgi:hypothetical protein